MNLKGVLRTVAPAVANLIGGPAGAVVRALVAQTLGKPADSSEDELAAAVATATPEQLAKLGELHAQLAGIDLDVERVHAGDRASARARDIAVKDRVPAFLAAAIVGGFFSLLFVIVFRDVPEKNRAIVEVMIGALGASVGSVIQFYFGSSKGSTIKDQTISKALNG